MGREGNHALCRGSAPRIPRHDRNLSTQPEIHASFCRCLARSGNNATACCPIASAITCFAAGRQVAPEREWYARQAIENGWSRSVLSHQIESSLFARQGQRAHQFHAHLAGPPVGPGSTTHQRPLQLRVPLLGADMRERDLQRACSTICDPCPGVGEGLRVRRQPVSRRGRRPGVLHRPALLPAADACYRRDRTRRSKAFKPEFAGKMNFYLSAVDDRLRHPDDQPLNRYHSLQEPK